MNPRRFSLVAGIVMIAMAVLSFIPSLSWNSEALPTLNLESSYGNFLGLFPMNILNKVVLLIFGIGGVVASQAKFKSLPLSILHARLVFYVMGAAAILGIFRGTSTLGGYWPLFSYEVLLHAVFAALGAYYGYRLSTLADERIEPLEGMAPSSMTSQPKKDVAAASIRRL